MNGLIRIVLTPQARKIVGISILFILIIVMVISFYGYSAMLQTKVNRTNALQVAKPVLPEQLSAQQAPDFFTEYRLERERMRSEKYDVLKELIKSAQTEAIRQDAQKQVLKMIQEKQQETEIENLIKARGFNDALIFIKDNAVSAVVKTNSLNKEEVVQIADVISRIAKVKAEDITISAKP